MRVLRTVSAFVASVVLAAPVMAEGFSVRDLGELSTREECMRRAELAMNAHAKGYGGDVVRSEWVVYGWNLAPGSNDVSFMCPVVNGGIINAFMVIHGQDREEDRTFVADQIERLFN